MRIYVVVREFQDGEVQNEFVHTSIKKAEKFIENDDWDMGELFIQTWEKGNKVCKCSICKNEVYDKDLKTLDLKQVCETCKNKLKKQY